MDEVTRSEIDKLHGRIGDLKERVVNLEAQRPHNEAALARIENSVKKLNDHLSKVVWAIVGLFIVALWKMILGGKLPLI